MTEFFKRMTRFPSDTSLAGPADEGFVIRFSNTGRRGKKWFSISQTQLRGALEDLLSNIDEFRRAGTRYDESAWRLKFDQFITDEVVNALSGVQTLPLFQLLAKAIAATDGAQRYVDGKIELDEGVLRRAIAEVS